MNEIVISKDDITRKVEAKVDIKFPISYEKFTSSEEYKEIRAYLRSFNNKAFVLLKRKIPNYLPEGLLHKILFSLLYTLTEEYKNILPFFKKYLGYFLVLKGIDINISDHKNILGTKGVIKNSILYNILYFIKALGNKNKLFLKDISVKINLKGGWEEIDPILLSNSFVFLDDTLNNLNFFKENALLGEDYNDLLLLFKNGIYQEKVEKNRIMEYLNFYYLVTGKSPYILFDEDYNGVCVVSEDRVSSHLKDYISIMKLTCIIGTSKDLDEDIREDIFSKYKKVEDYNSDKLYEDIKFFMKKTGNGSLKIDFKNQNPTHMKGKFKNPHFENYEELKKYTEDYGYTTTENHGGIKKNIVGEKKFKYKNDGK